MSSAPRIELGVCWNVSYTSKEISQHVPTRSDYGDLCTYDHINIVPQVILRTPTLKSKVLNSIIVPDDYKEGWESLG